LRRFITRLSLIMMKNNKERNKERTNYNYGLFYDTCYLYLDLLNQIILKLDLYLLVLLLTFRFRRRFPISFPCLVRSVLIIILPASSSYDISPMDFTIFPSLEPYGNVILSMLCFACNEAYRTHSLMMKVFDIIKFKSYGE